MPANDLWANAIALSGASGSTVVNNYNNNGAGTQTGEPGHFIYNPGPSYPVILTPPEGSAGPFNSVWFSWVCPASGNYFFSTLARSLTAVARTDFPSSCNVFTGSAVNALTRVTTIMDQSVGDGWGTDNGASIAFAAISGGTYYIQVDSRLVNITGNYVLTWGAYVPSLLGSCGDNDLNFNTATICYGTVQIADLTTDSYTSFGSFAAQPGIFAVRYVAGTNPFSGGLGFADPTSAFEPALAIVDGDFGSFVRWTDEGINTGTPYASGVFLSGSKPTQTITNLCAVSVAMVPNNRYDFAAGPLTANAWYSNSVTMPTSGANLGHFPPNSDDSLNVGDWVQYATHGYAIAIQNIIAQHPMSDGGVYWSELPTFSIPASFCSETQIPDHAGGGIGIICHSHSGAATNSTQNPSFQLVYYPFTIGMLSTFFWSTFSGSGTSWSMDFLITSSSTISWDQCTVELLNTGGISGASSAFTGVTLVAGTQTSSGVFSFTADPTAGFVTATIQISRNGVVVGTLSYPLYPVVSAIINDIAFGEFTCSGFKEWGNQLFVTQLYPTLASFPSAWGQTYNYVLSVVGGSPNLFDAHGAPCTAVSNLSGSHSGTFGFAFGLQATSSPQIVTMQCLFTFNGLSLPTFTGNVTVPPA